MAPGRHLGQQARRRLQLAAAVGVGQQRVAIRLVQVRHSHDGRLQGAAAAVHAGRGGLGVWCQMLLPRQQWRASRRNAAGEQAARGEHAPDVGGMGSLWPPRCRPTHVPAQ